MIVTAIMEGRVKAILNTIRNYSQLSPTVRHQIVEAILKEIDAVRSRKAEDLLCPLHACDAAGFKRRPKAQQTGEIKRKALAGNIHVYHVCCRNFYDKAEVTGMKGTYPNKGMVRQYQKRS